MRLRDLARPTAERAADGLRSRARARRTRMVQETLRDGGTLFFCGNGGSAADAQHIATEYVVRYMRNRRALSARSRSPRTRRCSPRRQRLRLRRRCSRGRSRRSARPGDLLVIHSTSGNSPNVLRAAEAAQGEGCAVLALQRARRRRATRAGRHSRRRPDDADRSRAGDAPLHRARHLRAGGGDAVSSGLGAREGCCAAHASLRRGGSPSARSSASRTRVRRASDPRIQSSPSSRALGLARRSTT